MQVSCCKLVAQGCPHTMPSISMCHDLKKPEKHHLRWGSGINESCSSLPLGFRRLLFSISHVQHTHPSHSKGQSWPWTSDRATCWWLLGCTCEEKSIRKTFRNQLWPRHAVPRGRNGLGDARTGKAAHQVRGLYAHWCILTTSLLGSSLSVKAVKPSARCYRLSHIHTPVQNTRACTHQKHHFQDFFFFFLLFKTILFYIGV